MHVLIPVASSVVDARTRSAFSPSCLDDIAEQLDRSEVPVTYEYRHSSVAGRTIASTARVVDKVLTVEAVLSPPWWSPADLERYLPSMGGGCGGRVTRSSNLDNIHVIERILINEVTLLQLHSSVDPKRPITKVPS